MGPHFRDAAAVPDGERKQATVFFSDLVGSTALIQTLDAEDGVALLDDAIDRMVKAVTAFDGRVTRIHGDGILALFGAPLAQEDHAERACAAAIEVRRVFADAHMRVRVGLDSGEVVIRRNAASNFDVGGLTVHLAARMERVAKPGTICLSASTQRLVRHRFETRQFGKVKCKGIRDPVEVFNLVNAKPEKNRWDALASQGLSPFVGRRAEMDAIRARLLPSAGPRRNVIFIQGHAGTGKSRLLHEAMQLDAAASWDALVVTSEPSDKRTSLLAVTRMLRTQLGTTNKASHPAIRARLVRWLADSGRIAEVELAALHALLDLPIASKAWAALEAEQRRTATIRALLAVMRGRARRMPLLLCFEDIHWLDEDSVELFRGLAQLAASEPIVILATLRPERSLEDFARESQTVITLAPLAPAECKQLMDGRLGADPQLDEIKTEVAARTFGVPLFIEETLQELVETGVLLGSDGHYRVGHAPDAIPIPPSVTSALAQRIDRLARPHKELLQVASVIGRVVSVRLLSQVLPRDAAAIEAEVEDLQRSELLSARFENAEHQLVFRHTLTRDVAYGGLLAAKRIDIHARVAECLARLHSRRIAEHAEAIADHAREGRLWEVAARFQHKAAEKAINRSNHVEAIRRLEEALESVKQLGNTAASLSQELEIRLALRTALNAVGEYRRRLLNLDRAEALARKLGQAETLQSIQLSRGSVLLQTGRVAEALKLGLAAHRSARKTGDRDTLVAAKYLLARASNYHGQFREAIAHAQEATALTRAARGSGRFGGMFGTATVYLESQLSLSHGHLGEFAAALRCGEEARKHAAKSGKPIDVSLAAYSCGLVHLLQGAPLRAIPVLEEGSRAADSRAVSSLFSLLGGALSCAYVWAGQHRKARELIERVDRLTEASRYMKDWVLVFRALFFIGDQASAEAIAAAQDALRHAQADRYAVLQAWSHWVYGTAIAATDPDGAAVQMVKAARRAAALDMRPLLANIWQAQAGLVREQAAERDLARRARALCNEMNMSLWLPDSPAIQRSSTSAKGGVHAV